MSINLSTLVARVVFHLEHIIRSTFDAAAQSHLELLAMATDRVIQSLGR